MAKPRIDCRTVDSIEPGVYYSHPNATSPGDCAEGCCEHYRCPDCGTAWKQEVRP